MNKRSKGLVLTGLFAALIAVCAWIQLPLTVPVTLQTFAVLTAAGLLGMKRGTAAVLVYMLLGAVGLPVFSGFKGGGGVLLGATGGYIFGFVLTALITGLCTDRFGTRLRVLIPAMALGVAACYAAGTAWFMAVYARTSGTIGLGAVLGMCVFPFLIPDALKIAAAALLVNRLGRILRSKGC